MTITPLLGFRGDCQEAFQLYERAFRGTIVTMLTYAATKEGLTVPPDWREKIFHATLRIGDQMLMGGDPLPEQYQPMQGVQLTIGLADPAEADRVFQALAEDGTVHMRLQETSWAIRFGVVADRFGISWLINCEAAADPSAPAH
jgi:PhnB protein